MKLKLASQRDISSIQEEAMTIETDATSASVSASSQNELSLPSMEAIEMETSKQTNCSASVSKSYQHSPSSSYEEAMTIDATGLSPGCSDCSVYDQLGEAAKKQEFINCRPVFQRVTATGARSLINSLPAFAIFHYTGRCLYPDFKFISL
ncbi:hypothetical protein CK203_115038 [Vitis vinifera]|uniref:Uncharacterized protein n=1 Tax=Vitis vinifera TaxID=29760 RepID=A0A438CXK2_VITVI|nr:hypothetical protein CK203_115038 [Vitis vinifera]